MLAASSAGSAGTGDTAPMSLNPKQQPNSAGIPGQASDHPAGSRPGQAQLRCCMRRARPLQAASAGSRKRVRFAALPPPQKRARREAPPGGLMHEPAAAAASAAAAAQEDSPLPDEWMPDVAAGYASAERRWDSEASQELKRAVEAYHYPDQLDCEEGVEALWEDADMPQAEQGVAGSSSDQPAALDAGHGLGWAAAGVHPAALTVGSLQAHQHASAGLFGPIQPELEADDGMGFDCPSEPDAMLSGGDASDIYDLS